MTSAKEWEVCKTNEKITLTVSYEEEKLKALRWYLEQKKTRLEDELIKAVDTLFQKNVPANVRSYICKDTDAPVEAPKPKKPQHHIQQTQPEVPADG